MDSQTVFNIILVIAGILIFKNFVIPGLGGIAQGVGEFLFLPPGANQDVVEHWEKRKLTATDWIALWESGALPVLLQSMPVYLLPGRLQNAYQDTTMGDVFGELPGPAGSVSVMSTSKLGLAQEWAADQIVILGEWVQTK